MDFKLDSSVSASPSGFQIKLVFVSIWVEQKLVGVGVGISNPLASQAKGKKGKKTSEREREKRRAGEKEREKKNNKQLLTRATVTFKYESLL
jgi:hypothetical protein